MLVGLVCKLQQYGLSNDYASLLQMQDIHLLRFAETKHWQLFNEKNVCEMFKVPHCYFECF